jgi:hypothetical protein
MRAAGWRDGAFFYEAALQRIVEATGGVPRLINTVAGKALLLTYLGGDQIVTAASVEEAARELWTAVRSKSVRPLGSALLGARLQARSAPIEVGGSAETVAAEPCERDIPVSLSESPPPRFQAVAEGPRPGRQSPPPAVSLASPSRRYAFLIAFAFAAALFTAKMSTEQGQREVIETAEPVIENVGRMAGELRELVASADPGSPREDAHIDWTPPPRPVPVLTRSARYASLQEPTAPSNAVRPAMGAAAVADSSLATVRTAALPVARSAAEIERDRAVTVRLDQRLRVRALMRRADEHVDAGRLTEPEGANALEVYSDVLAMEPAHEGARRGMGAIALRLEGQGRAAEQREDWEGATEYYRRALSIDTASAELRAALARSLVATANATPPSDRH